MDLISKKGFDFCFDPARCSTCQGFCCRGASGRIWVTPAEIEVICRFLNIHVLDAMRTHFYKVQGRCSIKEIAKQDEWWCIFLDESGRCTIYDVRPDQCRRFPFWSDFKAQPEKAAKECPGVILL